MFEVIKNESLDNFARLYSSHSVDVCWKCPIGRGTFSAPDPFRRQILFGAERFSAPDPFWRQTLLSTRPFLARTHF